MPHYYDLDGVVQRLFVLRHMSYGSMEYCSSESVHRMNETDAWSNYLGHLKSVVSESTIDAAVKLRMVQDFLKADEQEIDLEALDAQAREGISIGQVRLGEWTLSLRESCNKIIHATEARLCWKEQKANDVSIEFWTGGYLLSGSKGNEPWEVELSLAGWSTAMISFLEDLQMNIDWHRVHKYDE